MIYYREEPVAWKVIETDDEGSFTTFTEVEPVWADNAIPLYTTPQIKELTDEEIGEVMSQCDWQYDPESFARAIIKKASEK